MSHIDIEFREPNIARFEILGFNHGFVQPEGRSGGRPVEHQNVTFSKYCDEQTHALMQACYSAQRFKSAIINVAGADSKRSLTIVLKNVLISNFGIAAGAGDVPVENVSLDYGSIAYEYVSPKGVSSVTPEMTNDNAG